jgi:hypothetical protein
MAKQGGGKGRLIPFGLKLGEKAEVADTRMGDMEGQSNIAQGSERPIGRPFNLGVAKTADPRKSRKGRYR